MLDNIYKDCDSKMQKSIQAFQDHISKIRTGRVHPGLLEGVMVLYFDVLTPLQQLASIVVEDARTLAVSPFEPKMFPAIDKAIRAANLGLNPVTQGKTIKVPLPPLTEDARNTMIKQVKVYSEDAKVAIRQVRRDANDKLKKMLKDKELSQDVEKKAQDKIQKQTDQFIETINNMMHKKEQELKTI